MATWKEDIVQALKNLGGKAQFVCALPGHLEAGMYGNMKFK